MSSLLLAHVAPSQGPDSFALDLGLRRLHVGDDGGKALGGLRREEGEAGGSCGTSGEQGEERDSPRILRIAGRKKESSRLPVRATADQMRGFDFSFKLLSSFFFLLRFSSDDESTQPLQAL